MARLRSPVSRSEPKTSSSTSRLATGEGREPVQQPVHLLRPGRLRRPSPVVTIAPALTIGLYGRPRDVVQADGVERVAGRLDPDPRQDLLGAAVGQRQRVDERLGHRLDRERHEVAGGVHLTVQGREAEAAGARVGLRQLGDVRRHVAVVQPGHRPQDVVEQAVDRTASGVEHVTPSGSAASLPAVCCHHVSSTGSVGADGCGRRAGPADWAGDQPAGARRRPADRVARHRGRPHRGGRPAVAPAGAGVRLGDGRARRRRVRAHRHPGGGLRRDVRRAGQAGDRDRPGRAPTSRCGWSTTR